MKHNFKKTIICAAMLLFAVATVAQDIIITTDATKIDAQILEVSKTEIKYKELDNLNGPTFILSVDEISSIIYSTGKVVLYNQQPSADSQGSATPAPSTPTPTAAAPISAAPAVVQDTTRSIVGIDDKTIEILLQSGNTITGQLVDMKNTHVSYMLGNKFCTIPASQIQKVTFLLNGQVKDYSSITSAPATTTTAPLTTTTSPVTSNSSGRIYRENGQYLCNDIYITSAEVERILQRENALAYAEWQKADGMLVGGSICAGIGGGLVLGGLISLISTDPMVCLGIECSALVPLGVGLGLTLGSSAHYNKAINIYNSQYDNAAVQLEWNIAPNQVGFAIAF